MAEQDIYKPFADIHFRPNELEQNRARIASRVEDVGNSFIREEADMELRAGYLINVMSVLPKYGFNPMHLQMPDHYFPNTRVAVSVPEAENTAVLYAWLASDVASAQRDGLKLREFMVMGDINHLDFHHLEFTMYQHTEGDAKLMMIYPYVANYFRTGPVALPKPFNGIVKPIRANEIRRDNLLEFVDIKTSV